MRYAGALAICRDLHASAVPAAEIEAGVGRLLELLLRFSPFIEPSPEEPGVFWIDASGLIGLETSLSSWAERIRAALEEHRFISHIVVGFHRFSVYALARSRHPVTVFDDPVEERRASRAVRFDRLHLDPGLRDKLARLDIHTVGEFLELPVDGVSRRFGAEALQFYREAAEWSAEAMNPEVPHDPLDAWIELEHPERDAYRLTFAIQRVLPLLLQRIAGRGHGLTALTITLRLDDRTTVSDEIRPAEPTLDLSQILELVRLKLEATRIHSGAVEIELGAATTAIDRGQLELFAERPRRDLSAAGRALARIRAEFGRLTVVSARLHRAHLPEAGFSWEPLEQTKLPAPLPVHRRPLIRRIFARPVPLPQRGRHEPDGWLVRGPEQGSMTRISGPYTVSGGWWVREVHRDYHFVETARGDVMWVYYDRRRRRWFLQGQVE
jgi:protein ImuB